MAGLKETPRQKMMGILYLVLLGLAATTVTDHVLDAFRNLTVSLETSTKNVQSTVNNTFAAFEATNLKNDPVRARPIYDRATKVKGYCADLDKYIIDIKTELITKGGGMDEATGDVKARADVDMSPRLMTRKKNGENGVQKATQLKKNIEDTRSKILALLTPEEQKGLKLSLNAQDPPKRLGIQQTWEDDNFGDGIPLTAAITALTKIQADLKNTESDVVKKILGEANETQIVLDRFEAVAVAPSSYILVGQQYKADVFLTASSSTSNPEILIGGQKLNVVDGKGLYTAAATSEGEKKWGGVIRVTQSNGAIKEYQLPDQSYTVAKPSAVVSPDKMNVFYIGVPNPVSISAPGIAKDKIKVSISAGTVTGSNGAYVVNVSATGKVNVTVSGDIGSGKSVVLGTSEFRIKRIPPPRVKFGGKSGGKLGTGAMKAQNRIFAVLEDFDFDAPFTIQHFSLFITKPRGEPQVFESNSNAFTPAMSAAMNGIVSGSRVFIDNVFATGPDGMKRQLDPIAFSVE
jgi:gliding motility-associated protein GldM